LANVVDLRHPKPTYIAKRELSSDSLPLTELGVRVSETDARSGRDRREGSSLVDRRKVVRWNIFRVRSSFSKCDDSLVVDRMLVCFDDARVKNANRAICNGKIDVFLYNYGRVYWRKVVHALWELIKWARPGILRENVHTKLTNIIKTVKLNSKTKTTRMLRRDSCYRPNIRINSYAMPLVQ